MIAGTLATHDPVQDELEDWHHNDNLPALDVETTQTTHDNATYQSGTAATRLEDTRTSINLHTKDGVHLDTFREKTIQEYATQWYADPTGSGIVLAESLGNPSSEYPFPYDLIATQLGVDVHRQAIGIEDVHGAWQSREDLDEVWLHANDTMGDGTSIQYHESANEQPGAASIGLGFKRSWSGTIVRGVVYSSGYVALYSANNPAEALGFVASELHPYTRDWDPEEHEDQTDFDEFDGGA